MYNDLRSKIEMYKKSGPIAARESRVKGPDIHMVVDGVVCHNEFGPFFVIEKEFPLEHNHGGYPLGYLLDQEISPIIKACRDQGNFLSPSDLIFLDTETTGLSGGTGTLAFLIGVGFFTSNCFKLRQYFIRDYNEEMAALKALNEVLPFYKGLVTFNGKAFDWNLLQSRYIFNRMKLGLKSPVQIDLLYPSRLMWKPKLESCRLVSLEENILNIYRIDDIPGALIPGIYFKYLEDRNALDLKKVMHHNEMDILSLVSLMSMLNTILGNPFSDRRDGWELLGAGNIFEKCEDGAKAISCYEQCVGSENYKVKEVSLKKLALLYKMKKDYSKAAECLEQVLSSFGASNIPVMIELAKHYEHRIKDIPKALRIAQKAVDVCTQAGFIRDLYLPELKVRLERLKRKLN